MIADRALRFALEGEGRGSEESREKCTAELNQRKKILLFYPVSH